MVNLKGTVLIIPLLILSLTIMPIPGESLVRGLQSSSRNILSEGTIIYPGSTESQLGVWHVQSRYTIPSEASWVVATSPGHGNPEMLDNPGFELGLPCWILSTPPDKTSLTVNIQPGYVANSAVMVSDELGYRGGLSQRFNDVPPKTTFHFRAMAKTVDVEALEARILFWSIHVGGVWSDGGTLEIIRGSQGWSLYEVSFTTPNETARVSVFPALVYNRGEVWIDEASLTIEGWQPPTTPAILNWYEVHKPMSPFNPFVTEADINLVEQGLKTAPIEDFWGIVGPICEEHYRTHVEFADTVNTTYFDENLLGYSLYLAESPGATEDDWKDEMFLRMVRGFHNYFSPSAEIGITVAAGAIVMNWKDQAWSDGILKYYGEPAMTFIREYYDFVFLYAYTDNPEMFTNWTNQYFQLIDQLFEKQKKFWILPIGIKETKELEAMSLEMKNCLDRNIAITLYSSPPFEEIWPLMLKAIELYNAKAPYYETPVYGTNLLTGYVGDTYGWIEVS